MSANLLRSLIVLMIMLCAGWNSALAETFQYARSDLPVTHNIGPEDAVNWQFPLVQLQFTQDKFIFPNGGGQSLFYASEAAAIAHDSTQITGLLRIVNNAAGMGEVDFTIDPATVPSLPPLPPTLDFELHLFLNPGEAFAGEGPVALIAPVPGLPTEGKYVSITRGCNASFSTGLGQAFCGPTALPDTQFQLTINLVPEPSTGWLLGLGLFLLALSRRQHYVRIAKTVHFRGAV